MDRRESMPEFHSGGSTRRTSREAWPPENARDAWWEDLSFPTASQRLLAWRRDAARQLIRFLFVHGGLSVVLLFGLMAFGVIMAFFQ